jgi:Glycosyltransferase family 87
VAVRSESWSLPAEPGRTALLVAFALVLFVGTWAALHAGFYTRSQIVDTPVYQRYGDAIAHGQVPYRDFGVEYPPGALPVFALPALGHADKADFERFRQVFEALMWACGALALVAMALALRSLGARPARAAAALAFAAFSPLALGSVVLSRFDLWPAALTVCALAALLARRHRLGSGLLGLAVAVKVYPVVLAPLAVVYVWRERGRREALACLGVLAAVVAACFAPFLALAPGGVWDSVVRQTTRPLQLESLGSGVLLALHHVFGLTVHWRSSHGSQNLVGTGPDAIGALQTVLQVTALLAVWWLFARGRGGRDELVRSSAAAVVAFVALGKVLSPQYLIWLVPLVPLIRGRRGLQASALLGVALALTQAWFPFRYWDLVFSFDETASWLVLVRDLVLLALMALLLRREESPAG